MSNPLGVAAEVLAHLADTYELHVRHGSASVPSTSASYRSGFVPSPQPERSGERHERGTQNEHSPSLCRGRLLGVPARRETVDEGNQAWMKQQARVCRVMVGNEDHRLDRPLLACPREPGRLPEAAHRSLVLESGIKTALPRRIPPTPAPPRPLRRWQSLVRSRQVARCPRVPGRSAPHALGVRSRGSGSAAGSAAAPTETPWRGS